MIPSTPRPMEKLREPLEVALDASEKRIAAIPCRGKVPLVKWKPWQTELPPVELLREWFRDTRANVAILTTGMVLFDVDDPELVELVLQHCGPTPHVVRTPRGGTHLGYRARKGVEMRNQVDIKGHDIDIRTDGGIEVIFGRTEDGEYSGLPEGLHAVAELPVARIGWTRERKRKEVKQTIEIVDGDFLARRARAWLACVEGAVSGRGGHNATFRVACKLTHPPPRGFGLSFEQAWPLILEWNEQCEPPWSERELTHKLSDAISKR